MSTIKWLKHLPDNGVYTLRGAQNSLLQVLLSRFSLSRDGHGFTLNVSFKESDSTIRKREAKKCVQNHMPGYRCKEAEAQKRIGINAQDHFRHSSPDCKITDIQNRIDDVFFRGENHYSHNNPEFVFRYASGGTLPIIELNSAQYYCLFYRDAFPVGWNIANGACDSLPELLDPMRAIERELREELIVLALHTPKPLDYVFTWLPKPKTVVVVPEFEYARRLANRFLAGGLDIGKDFYRRPLKVDWDPPGPDTLRVQFDGYDPVIQQGFYLNINATDFGIELDRIARIRLVPGTTLLDGEINDNQLLNRPIGLFEIGKTQKAVYDGSTKFLPDLLFYGAALEPNPPASLAKFENEIIKKKFLPHLLRIKVRDKKDIEMRKEIPLSNRFDLCPVTRSIIRRHMRAITPRVFMSYSHTDRSFAKRLEQDLVRRGIEVWQDTKDLQPTIPIDISIERAIEDSSHLLLLASQYSVTSEFIRDEVQYAYDLRKPKIALMLEPCKVPIGAGRWPRIDFQHRYKEALDDLVRALFLKSNE